MHKIPAFVLCVAVIVAFPTAAQSKLVVGNETPVQLERHKQVQHSINAAIDCMLRTMSADPRSTSAAAGDALVDAVTACQKKLVDMVNQFDEAYGEGRGLHFFDGQFLELVTESLAKRSRQ